MDTGIQTDDCFVMRPRSSSKGGGGGAIQIPQLLFAVNGLTISADGRSQ